MAFHTEKDLKSKNVRDKKVYILAKDINICRRKFFMRPKTGSRSQIAWIFLLQNVHLITKYLLSEKIIFSLHYKVR